MGTCIVYDPTDGMILCAFYGQQKNEAAFAGNWANWPSSERLWIDLTFSLTSIDRTHKVVGGELVKRAEPLPAPEPEPTLDEMVVDLVDVLLAKATLTTDDLPARLKGKIDQVKAAKV